MDPFNWKCPYCGHAQAVTDRRHSSENVRIYNDKSAFGPMAMHVESIVCANEQCKKMTLHVGLYRRKDQPNEGWNYGDALHDWPLLPESSAKPQPDYIPQPIVNDYSQACRIRDLSPNASATMARRCLQGMIRDFCGISKATLAKEIDTLQTLFDEGKAPRGVAQDTLDAIDHVRTLGNIGAHMEKDINLILDVDPNEAQTLIGLIELLFEEWYVAQHQRQEKLKRLGVAVAEKESKKALPAPPAALPAPADEDTGNSAS